MAVPSAPASIVVRPGPHPQSLYVNASEAATATSYTVYIDSATGVGQAQYRWKQVSTDVDIFVEGIPFQGPYFVNMTASNGDGESVDGTEVETNFAGV